jgi:NAD(P)H-dependent flavin oxidoreductase YrpB (nitropropane dioxygenase family)
MPAESTPPPEPLRTRVSDRLGIPYPIVLGGMSSATAPALVAAVSNAGGLGTLGLTGRAPAEVPALLADVRAQTAAPFGVNFLVFRYRPDDPTIAAALAARPPVVSYAWAWSDQDLRPFITRAHDAGAQVTYMVSGVPDAVRAVEAGADLIVAQGSEGGGHVGLMGTMALVPLVVDAVAPVPVLAAGGIADGRGLVAALALGAEGVLLGTRFLATDEAPLHPRFKAAIVASDGHDTELTELPDLASGTVWPGAFSRVQRNAFVATWNGREAELRRRRGEVAAAIAEARAAGDPEQTPLLFGQDAGLISTILPAGEVVRRLVAEARTILGGRLRSIES